MKLVVTIKYRDDSSEEIECVDFPSISDWITLYKPQFERIVIPRDAVAKITYKIIKLPEAVPSPINMNKRQKDGLG